MGYLYREVPDDGDEDDSGWRIKGGEESDEYMEDSNNFVRLTRGGAQQDDSFRHLLDVAAPCAFLRNRLTGRFRAAYLDSGTFMQSQTQFAR